MYDLIKNSVVGKHSFLSISQKAGSFAIVDSNTHETICTELTRELAVEKAFQIYTKDFALEEFKQKAFAIEAVCGFLAAIEFAEFDQDQAPRFTLEALKTALDAVLGYLQANKSLIKELLAVVNLNGGSFGHNLWLTFRGHGAGFFDLPMLYRQSLTPAQQKDLESIATRLTESASNSALPLNFEHSNGWIYL